MWPCGHAAMPRSRPSSSDSSGLRPIRWGRRHEDEHAVCRPVTVCVIADLANSPECVLRTSRERTVPIPGPTIATVPSFSWIHDRVNRRGGATRAKHRAVPRLVALVAAVVDLIECCFKFRPPLVQVPLDSVECVVSLRELIVMGLDVGGSSGHIRGVDPLEVFDKKGLPSEFRLKRLDFVVKSVSSNRQADPRPLDLPPSRARGGSPLAPVLGPAVFPTVPIPIAAPSAADKHGCPLGTVGSGRE
ncbi:hypothetical protein F5144DRAFT_575196 [Chaetomium tenue]|uniref:Uncharacterized protein n=1 Tax=Chaetomium tenue TaxID=1854479 RepID=A0ACB7P8X1_9PEZI|nr:hypothetical protein F5144DRAFT_575196 [Chaetomium globosum]